MSAWELSTYGMGRVCPVLGAIYLLRVSIYGRVVSARGWSTLLGNTLLLLINGILWGVSMYDLFPVESVSVHLYGRCLLSAKLNVLYIYHLNYPYPSYLIIGN